MNNPPFLNAGTPFLRNTPNSLVSREWVQLLNYLLESSGGNMANSIYIKLFQPSILGTTAAQIASIPAKNPNTNQLLNGGVFLGGQVRLTNSSSAAVSATLYAVPAPAHNVQAQVAQSNDFCPGLSVPANGNLDVNMPVMWAGDQLWASASTTGALTIHHMNGNIFGP